MADLCRVCGGKKDSKTTSNLCRRCEALKKKESRVRERIADDIYWLNKLHSKQGYYWTASDMDDNGKAIDYIFIPKYGDTRDDNTIAARADGLLWASVNGCNYTLRKHTVKRWEMEVVQ